MVEPFLAREDEQDRFISVLQHVLDQNDEPDEGFLVVVQGHGGIGKTQLLHRFGDILRGKVRRPGINNRFYVVEVDWSVERQNRPTDFASWAGPPIWVALDALYVGLRDEVTGWVSRRRFERAFAHYREQAAQTKAAAQPAEPAPSRLPDVVGAAMSLIGGLAPVPGAAAASGSAAKLVTGLAQSARDARGRVDDKKYDSLIGPDDALVRAFANGVKDVSRHRPVVLILDTAELLGEARDRIRQAVKRSGARTVWVWGIRLEEEANAAEDSETTFLRRVVDNSRLRLVPLNRFDDRTIEQYLRTRLSSVPLTAELIRGVVSLTRGIPLAVHLAATLLSTGVPPAVALQEVSGTGEVSEIISGLARRYLIHLTETPNPEMRADLKLIYGLALLDGPSNDPDLLAALWEVPAHEVAARLDGLTARHDFVLSGRRRLHQEIRRTIRLFLLDPVRRPEVRAANERATSALRERMAALNRTTVEAQLADEEWRAHASQLLWHTFWVSNRGGIRLLAELLPAAHTLAPSLAADLLHTADWFEATLTPEQRAILAGARLLLPSSSFLNRLQSEFRRAAERLNRHVSNSAVDMITDVADTATGILAPDVPPIVFVLLLTLEAPVDNDDERPASALEQMVTLLPATGAGRLRQIVAAQVEAFTRDIVSKPDVKNAAAEVSRIAVRLAPANATMYWLLARACQAVGDFDAALEAIDEACRREPRKADWHIVRGMILRDLERFEDSLAAYEEACQIQPAESQWHDNRSIALRRLKRFEDSLAAYEEVCRLRPGEAQSHGHRGALLAGLGRFEDSLAAYEEACRLRPDEAQWHNSRAVALDQLGRIEDSLAAYEEACRLRPDDAHLHGNRGIVLGRLGRYEDSLAAYEKACELEAGNAQWHGNRGMVLSRLRRYEDSLAAYEKACELEAGNAQWHGNRGIALGRLGRHGDSLAAYEEACGLAPGEAQWHNGRGIVLGRLGRHEDSLAAYEKACELRPDEAQWHNSRGIVLSRLNRYEESLAALEQAVHLAPDVPYILHNHAEALVLLGRDAEAVDALRGSVASGDDQLESSVLLAAMLHRTDLEEARELCQVALTMPGKSMGTFRRGEMRAVAYALLGRLEVAEDELRRAFTDRTDADVLQSRLYELIESGAGDGDGRVDRLMAVWREHETAPGEGEA